VISAFASSFAATLVAILDIFLVIAAAGLLVRRGIVTQAHINGLSATTVTVFLPCLIFSKVTSTLDPAALPLWWMIPLIAIALSAAALGLATLAFLGKLPQARNLLPLASMQNAGYLVLPVGLSLYPAQFDRFALYCFLFILGFNPVLWSLGKMLSTGSGGSAADEPAAMRRRAGWRGMVTPPLVANLAAIAVVLTGAVSLIPPPAARAVELIGSAAVPVATFILGAVLGSIPLELGRSLGDAARVVTVKLLVLPALVVTVLVWLPAGLIDPLLARFLVIEAAAAPAAGIILMVRSYGGDETRIGSIMLASYALCTLTLPAWVAIWSLLEQT